MAQAFMAIDSCVAEGRILVASESKDCLVHLLGVEYSELDEQVEVLDCEPGDGQK